MGNGGKHMCIIGRLLAPLLLYEIVTEFVFWSAHQVVNTEPFPALAFMTLSAAITWGILLFVRRGHRLPAGGERGGTRCACLPGYLLFPVTAGSGMCLLLNALIRMIPFPESAFSSTLVIYQPPIMIQVLGTGLIIPAAEEMIFRGTAFFSLRDVLPARAAILISALYFGIFHGNLVQGIYAFILGIFLAWLAEKSGGLMQPWAFHAGANLTSIGMMAAREHGLALEKGIWPEILPWIGAAVAFAAFAGISRTRNEKR